MPRGSRNSAGFTLLEMLVALAILAIAAGAGTLALRPDERRLLDNEAERLALLLEQAREESELGGSPLAWVAGENGYEFQRREVNDDGIEWNVVRGDDLLRPRRLPAGLRIHRLDVDGRAVAWGERVRLEPARPVRVELALGAARVRVLGTHAGFLAEPATSGLTN